MVDTLSVVDYLKARNEKEGYSVDMEGLVETLQESGTVVWEDGYIDMHRWYGVQEVVYKLDDKFIGFYNYIITGDNGVSDMGLEYDLADASFVTKKTRTIEEVYYA